LVKMGLGKWALVEKAAPPWRVPVFSVSVESKAEVPLASSNLQ
jgi:hypothetical protein